jgi:voltage-dependent calcium channel
MYGLANMSLFLILVNFIAALITVQLLRGDLSADKPVNFGNLFNAYLGVYQVGSSENWTNVLYGAAVSEQGLGQTVLVTLFIASWMLFANCESFARFIEVAELTHQIH